MQLQRIQLRTFASLKTAICSIAEFMLSGVAALSHQLEFGRVMLEVIFSIFGAWRSDLARRPKSITLNSVFNKKSRKLRVDKGPDDNDC